MVGTEHPGGSDERSRAAVEIPNSQNLSLTERDMGGLGGSVINFVFTGVALIGAINTDVKRLIQGRIVHLTLGGAVRHWMAVNLKKRVGWTCSQ